jgi:hypothetical protein
LYDIRNCEVCVILKGFHKQPRESHRGYRVMTWPCPASGYWDEDDRINSRDADGDWNLD